jgi:hypothetical protein
VEQRLHLLIPTAMAKSHKTKRRFLICPGMATESHNGSKRPAIAERQHRIQASPLRPGVASQNAKLEPQGLLPTCRMGPGGGPESTQRRPLVMARGTSSIRAGKVEESIKSNRLQRQRDKGMGGAKSIEIHQIKTLAAEKTISQQPVGRVRRLSQQATPLQRGKVAVQQGESLGIGVIRPETANLSLQPVAQGTQTAARHQIQHPWGPRLRDRAGKKDAQVSRRSGSRIKKPLARVKRGRAFVEECAAMVHQQTVR